MNDIEKFIFLYCQPTELYLSSDNLFFKIKTEVVLAKPFFLRMPNEKPEVGIKFKQFEPYPSPPDQYRLIWLIEECAKVILVGSN